MPRNRSPPSSTEDREQAVILNTRVESTHLARNVMKPETGFPLGPGATLSCVNYKISMRSRSP